MKNSLLHDPLVFSRSLAAAIGLNEAIILHQLGYWLEKSTNVVNGRKWVYNTLDEWAQQFPFMSVKTIQRTLSSLKEQGVIEVDNTLNKHAFDRTNWYSINEENLEKVSDASPQTDTAMTPIWDDDDPNLGSSYQIVHSNNTAVDVALQASHRRKKPVDVKPPKSDPVKLFREFTNRWPNKAGEELINLHVTDLEVWRKVLGEWLTRGYSPVNVKGMVEWYINPSLCEIKHNVKSASSKIERTRQANKSLQARLVAEGKGYLLE